MNNWYNLSFNTIINFLKSDEKRGLSFKQLEINLKTAGKNSLNLGGKEEESEKKKFLKEVSKIAILITFIFFILGYVVEGLVIFILNFSIAYGKFRYTKNKEEQFNAINNLDYTDVWVLRAGNRDLIKAEDLVVGDIVLLKKGNIVPADIRIINSKNLRINERNILGEEFISLKNPSKIYGEPISVKEIYNMAFRGTRVIEGEGKGIVVNIGTKTNLGSIVRYFHSFNSKKEKSLKAIKIFKKKFNLYSLIFLAIIIGIFSIIKSSEVKSLIFYYLFIIAIVNLMDIIELLVVKKKVKELSAEGININDKDSFSKLNDIDLLILDKLETISESRMEVKAFYTNRIINESGKVDRTNINEERLINIALLCNDSKYNNVDDSFVGDLKEGAILKFASKNNIFKGNVEGKNKRIFKVINNGDKEIKTTVNRINKNYRANVRGNLEDILSKSNYIMINGIERPITNEEIENLKIIDFNFINRGFITEAIAYRSFNYEPTEEENIENNLVFLGLIAYENPIKENAKLLIGETRKRKIIPIIITEENKITAYRSLKELSIVNNMTEVISGVEMLSLSKDEFIEVLGRAKAFCKVTPEMRNKIIETYVDNKYKVATTVENLSNMPSVLLSEISIAKGDKVSGLVNTLSTVNMSENILENLLKLYDFGKVYKGNLNKALEFLKKFFIIEFITIPIIAFTFNLNLTYYIIFINLILGLLLYFMILKYNYFKEKIALNIELITEKWKVLKKR
ncbi:MAG: cation-transporting P-type ATPase [Sarcina sp.]